MIDGQTTIDDVRDHVTRGMAAQAAADEAVARVERHAEDAWMDAATRIVKALALVRDRFTADDVWDELDESNVDAPHEPRAMGAVMRRAKAAGWIEATMTFVAGRREQGHGHPCRVWKSKINGGTS